MGSTARGPRSGVVAGFSHRRPRIGAVRATEADVTVVVPILDPQYRSYCRKLLRRTARARGSDLMNEANDDAIWERTLQTLRRDDTVSQRVIALLTLSRLMAVVADTALVAAPSTSAKELFENRIAMSLKAALSE